eukprot:jgi/Undpi1/2833/HiC_scaffold_14.g06210.m1
MKSAAALALLLASGGPSVTLGGDLSPSRPLAFTAVPPARACRHRHHRRDRSQTQLKEGWLVHGAAKRERPRKQLSKGWLVLGTYEGSRRDAAGVRRRGREGVGGSNGPSAAVREGRVGLAAAVEGRGGGSGGEGVEERCIRRLGVAATRVWTDYYTNSDVRESRESLGVFLVESTAALDAGASPENLSRLLKAELLRTSERLDYQLDGDLPMVLYRFWNRGRAVDVYERDLFHCPRWIELVAETRKQMDAASTVVVQGDMGTICYPNGDIFEGEVDSLVQLAQGGESPAVAATAAATTTTPTTTSAVDAEVSSPENGIPGAQGLEEGGEGVELPPSDVRTLSGLVALTVSCLEDGLTDEATILQRHLRSPDFGHPLLRLASPSSTDVDFPHMPDEDEESPEMRLAEDELTDEHLALGERGAKELMHDRRRSQLDVYLICAAYRAHLDTTGLPARKIEAGWNLNEEDARILDGLVNKAAAVSTES